MNRDLPPGKRDLRWVADSSTLIYGERDAILVDTALTISQTQVLVGWVVASGKNLKAIYITHGHGDHFFGLAAILERYPQARALAVPDVIREMNGQVAPDVLKNFWYPLFPKEIPKRLLVADPLDKDELELEGRKLVVVDTGRTDARHSTALHVPSLDLVVAGDTVYNGIHPSFDGASRKSRLDWVSALGKLDALKPKAVVAGHKVPDRDDDPRSIAETRRYILDFNRIQASKTSARQVYDAMLELYPNYANPGSLWGSANAAKKQP